MTNNFYPPITPPPELVIDWRLDPGYMDCTEKVTMVTMTTGRLQYIATQAARWGADQQLDMDADQINQAWQKGADHELEACCEWVSQWCGRWPDGTRPEDELRAARRPKLLSLKEQALAQVESFACSMETLGMDSDLIRRALEQLND